MYQPCEAQIFDPEDKPWESAKSFDQKLISESEYQASKQKILNEMMQ